MGISLGSYIHSSIFVVKISVKMVTSLLCKPVLGLPTHQKMYNHKEFLFQKLVNCSSPEE